MAQELRDRTVEEPPLAKWLMPVAIWGGSENRGPRNIDPQMAGKP